MADDEEEDFVFYGTALQDEQESVAGQRRKPVVDRAAARQLPVWKQEVTDAEGRRRFHGAFEGGYSAGYFNTVGSKEGWAPATFTSSRAERTQKRQQTAEDFMDEDELAELGRPALQATAAYDTFGAAAAERAQRAAAADAAARPSVPSLVPEDVLVPVAESIGTQLLQKMGWRQGKGVGPAPEGEAGPPAEGSGGRKRRWGREAGLSVENTPVFTLAAKQDVYGLGFDPYKGAEEFRDAKRQRGGEAPRSTEPGGGSAPGRHPPGGPPGARQRGVAFGSGIAEDDDVYGTGEDYVDPYSKQAAFHSEIHSDEEEGREAVPKRPLNKESPQGGYRLPGRAQPLALQSAAQHAQRRGVSIIPGFVRGPEQEAGPVYPPPQIPRGWVPRPPVLQTPVVRGGLLAQSVPPPGDAALLHAIETLAPYVARNGAPFEALALRCNAGNPRFGFLSGGEGASYYRHRVQVLRSAGGGGPAPSPALRSAPLTADSRGALLGEQPLPSSDASGGAAPGLPPPVPLRDSVQNIAEGDRRELRATLAGNFVSAAVEGGEAPQGGLRRGPARTATVPERPPPPPTVGAPGLVAAQSSALAAAAEALSGRFGSGGVVEPERGGIQGPAGAPPGPAQPGAQPQGGERPLPKRSVEEWRPSPLLCKRFNVPDPFRGKAAPQGPSRFKTDHLQLHHTAAAAAAHALPPSFGGAQGEAAGGPSPSEQPQSAPPGAAATPPGAPSAAAAAEEAVVKDSKALADDFLNSLGIEEAGLPPPPPRPPAVPPDAAGGAAAAAAALPGPPQPAGGVTEKPLDLFKAIFEASDSEEEEEEGEDGRSAAQQQQQQDHEEEAGRRGVREGEGRGDERHQASMPTPAGDTAGAEQAAPLPPTSPAGHPPVPPGPAPATASAPAPGPAPEDPGPSRPALLSDLRARLEERLQQREGVAADAGPGPSGRPGDPLGGPGEASLLAEKLQGRGAAALSVQQQSQLTEEQREAISLLLRSSRSSKKKSRKKEKRERGVRKGKGRKEKEKGKSRKGREREASRQEVREKGDMDSSEEDSDD